MWKVLVCALMLSGCATVNAVSNYSISQDKIDAARSAYDGAFLVPAVAYRRLGFCGVVKPPCADKGIVKKLQKADKVVQVAFVKLQNAIDVGNGSGIAAAYATLQSAIASAEALMNGVGK